jgi:hypothetical protein
VTYKDISVERKENIPVLRLTTSIYSKKENKIIHEKETYGHAGFYKNKYGDLMRCYNDLQCLLETGVKSSTEEIFRIISKRQKK